jgi:hypothetical protein
MKFQRMVLVGAVVGALVSATTAAENPPVTRIPAEAPESHERPVGGYGLSHESPTRSAEALGIFRSASVPSAGRQNPGQGLAAPRFPQHINASYLVRRTVIISGLLIVASAISLWLGHRRRAGTGQGEGAASPLQILSTVTVAPRCCLHLVRVADHKFLVARDSSGWKSVTAVDSFAANLDVEEPTSAEPGRPTGLPAVPHDPFPSRNGRWQELNLNR